MLSGYEHLLGLCNHEGGHVCIFRLLGFPVRGASVDPIEVGPHGKGGTWPNYPDDDRPIDQLRFDYTTAVMAGRAMDDRIDASSDIDKALQFARESGCGTDDEVFEYVQRAEARAKTILESQWGRAIVDAVSALLLDRRTVGHDELNAAIDTVLAALPEFAIEDLEKDEAVR